MAINFVDEFKKLWKNQRVDASVAVGLMIWASAKRQNIENMSIVNTHMKWVDRNVYISELTLLNELSGFVRSPSAGKEDKSLDFFYNDVCDYYGWTRNELEKNRHVLDWEFLRGEISKTYAYDSKQSKSLKKQS